MSSPPHFLLAEKVTKQFGITRALDAVTVSFARGEVHALMGENGAGKSTLGKVIAGLHKPDQGRVVLDGRELRAGSIDDAFAAGVRIVHQELAQCHNLSVAENLCLHDMPRRRGLVDRRAMEDRAERLLRDLDPAIDVRAPVGALAPGRRQIVQIAASLDDGRAGGHGPRVIVFDEPTSSLSIAETDRLLEIVRRLASGGLTVIYVSHRMGEIFAVCDRVTVLRDGRFVATSLVREIDEPTLVEQMIGRRLTTPSAKTGATLGAARIANGAGLEAGALLALAQTPHGSTAPGADAPAAGGTPALVVRDLRSPGKIEGVGLEVAAGEIVGIGGLVGSGRSEVLDAIFGVDGRAAGQVEVGGRLIPRGRVRAMIQARVGYVPEDRRLQGLFFELGVAENILAPTMPALARAGVRSPGAEARVARQRVESFQVKAARLSSPPGSLSGGNQQKLLLARWMADDIRVLLLDEPTRGIDVGTKAEVYKLIEAAARRGVAVLLVSSEMPELLALSDRILVMADGCVTGELRGDDKTQTNILTLATRPKTRATVA